MKRYIIFAGVNGAGKTTLYATNDDYSKMPRINMDEIVREFGSWRNPSDVARAGKIAVRKIQDCFSQGISFNQETTLCGRSILGNISKAKQLGYRVELYYIGLDSAELAKERVARRVRDGGHGVPPEDIERRYYESFHNLREIIPICDIVKIYDNSTSFSLVSTYVNGECVDRSETIPGWCETILSEI